jgi:hypothetical protein
VHDVVQLARHSGRLVPQCSTAVVIGPLQNPGAVRADDMRLPAPHRGAQRMTMAARLIGRLTLPPHAREVWATPIPPADCPWLTSALLGLERWRLFGTAPGPPGAGGAFRKASSGCCSPSLLGARRGRPALAQARRAPPRLPLDRLRRRPPLPRPRRRRGASRPPPTRACGRPRWSDCIGLRRGP